MRRARSPVHRPVVKTYTQFTSCPVSSESGSSSSYFAGKNLCTDRGLLGSIITCPGAHLEACWYSYEVPMRKKRVAWRFDCVQLTMASGNVYILAEWKYLNQNSRQFLPLPVSLDGIRAKTKRTSFVPLPSFAVSAPHALSACMYRILTATHELPSRHLRP